MNNRMNSVKTFLNFILVMESGSDVQQCPANLRDKALEDIKISNKQKHGN